MAGSTPQAGWPFPSSSDLIAEGAVNIEQLGEGIEADFYLPAGAHNADDPYTDYPVPGMSIFNANTSVTGWPYTYGTVVTIKRATNQAWQWFYAYTTVAESQKAYLRIGYTGSGTPKWSSWQTVVGPGTPNAMAAGRVTVTPTAGEPKAVTITLPSGRFKTESEGGLLLVQLSAGGATHPEDISLCTYSISPTTLVVYIWRKSATDTAISWQVTQGLVAAN